MRSSWSLQKWRRYRYKVVECERGRKGIGRRKKGRKEQVCERWEGKKEKWATRVGCMRLSLKYAQGPIVQLVDKRRRPWIWGALMRAVFTLGLDWHSSYHEVHLLNESAAISPGKSHLVFAMPRCPANVSRPSARGSPISQDIGSSLTADSVDARSRDR